MKETKAINDTVEANPVSDLGDGVKKKMSALELLEQAKKAKAHQTNNRFIKKSGSKRDKDECRRVNFNR